MRGRAKIPKRAERSSQWKTGRHYSKDGHVVITLHPKDDFFRPMCWKRSDGRNHFQAFEHRLVMAKYLGRCLKRLEIVHHINGIKDDNRIENLELLSSHKRHKVIHPYVTCPHCLKAFVLINEKPINSFL